MRSTTTAIIAQLETIQRETVAGLAMVLRKCRMGRERSERLNRSNASVSRNFDSPGTGPVPRLGGMSLRVLGPDMPWHIDGGDYSPQSTSPPARSFVG